MRRGIERAPGLDDEGLQADVMRFMAIIAFCLVAIMALARNASPLETVASADDRADAMAVASPPAAGPAAPELPSARKPEPEPENPAAEARVPRSDDARGAAVPLAAAPAAQAGVEPRRAAPEPAAPQPAAPEPVVRAAETEPTEPAEPTDPTEPGLSLRFASERDFLRLVRREAIDVYAWRDGEVLALAAGGRFAPAPAPGRIHELLPGTIPAPITRALADAAAGADGFSWGVRLPGRIERRIRARLDAGASGVLVIDRFGEVRLLPARSGEETSR